MEKQRDDTGRTMGRGQERDDFKAQRFSVLISSPRQSVSSDYISWVSKFQAMKLNYFPITGKVPKLCKVLQFPFCLHDLYWCENED